MSRHEVEPGRVGQTDLKTQQLSRLHDEAGEEGFWMRRK
jgi:hypothetical protein